MAEQGTDAEELARLRWIVARVSEIVNGPQMSGLGLGRIRQVLEAAEPDPADAFEAAAGTAELLGAQLRAAGDQLRREMTGR